MVCRQEDGEMKIRTNLIRMRGDARLHGVNAVETEATYIWRAINGTQLSVCIVTSDSDQDLQIDTNQVAEEFVYHDFKSCPELYPNTCKNRGRTSSTGKPGSSAL